MRVVVAGAHGFIGRAIARVLTAASHQVIELEAGESVEELAARLRATSGAETFLVWAAGRREADLEANRAVHVEAALHAVRVLKPARVVYLSSGECYGDVPVPYREDGPVLGTSPYAIAKLEGEREMADLCLREEFAQLRVTVLRLGVVYGPGQAPSMLVPQVVEALRAKRRIALTPGTQTRDFVFVDDVAAAVLATLPSNARTPVLNIASGTEVAVRDVVLAIAKSQGAPAELLGFGDLAPRADDAARYLLDISLAERVLRWKPTTSLEEGVARL